MPRASTIPMSLTITLAIVIAITERTCGFTIPRPDTTSDSIPDLTVEESSLVESIYKEKSNIATALKSKKNDAVSVTAIKDTLNIVKESEPNLSVINDFNVTKSTPNAVLLRTNTTENYDTSDQSNIKISVTTESKTMPSKSNLITNNKQITAQTTADTKHDMKSSTTYEDQQTTMMSTISLFMNKSNISMEMDKDTTTLFQTDIIPNNTENITITTDPTDITETFLTTRITDSKTSLKDYVTIDGQHITSTTEYPSLSSNADMMKAETARLSLDHVSLQPLPSLDTLKQSYASDKLLTTQAIKMHTSEGLPDPLLVQSTESPTIKLGMVVSKRGGYLVNTEATTLRLTEDIISSTAYFNNVNASSTERTRTVYESETIDGTINKNASSIGSRSQLVEDAIKEELLEEKIMNEYEENMKRYHENVVKPYKTASSPTDHELATEDSLKVKPIFDKKINASLYAVKPNYKPLKKIEVQPSKQFVRDPDDNSWRNESISSLGIVFKPKNSSKSYTQVLKNKTEIELNNVSDKDNKGEIPDLKVRLEKMAEVRKSKKKKINKFGDVVYSDYEENSSENAGLSPIEFSTTSSTPFLSIFNDELLENKIKEDIGPITTKKPKKIFNNIEYYDTSDEYDADYAKMAKIDIKKSTLPVKTKITPSIQTPEIVNTTPLTNYVPDRQPTVQYFPPTKKTTQRVNMNDYDADFRRKLNLYTFQENPKHVLTIPHGTVSPGHTQKYKEPQTITTKPSFTPLYNSGGYNRNHYFTNQHVTPLPEPLDPNEGDFNRASYVIKHYRDFINAAVKDDDEDRAMGFLPMTESPVRGVTIDELAKLTEKDAKSSEEVYDYDSHFRKEVINRFVDNFNQNSDRFKVDFPVLYNNSVVHQQLDEKGKVLASSNAFLQRQYETGRSKVGYIHSPRACDPHCDNMTSLVELSPDYELHYYVPEQEEREEMEQKPPIMDSYSNRNTHV